MFVPSSWHGGQEHGLCWSQVLIPAVLLSIHVILGRAFYCSESVSLTPKKKG